VIKVMLVVSPPKTNARQECHTKKVYTMRVQDKKSSGMYVQRILTGAVKRREGGYHHALEHQT
jgi:hypothetical protein